MTEALGFTPAYVSATTLSDIGTRNSGTAFLEDGPISTIMGRDEHAYRTNPNDHPLVPRAKEETARIRSLIAKLAAEVPESRGALLIPGDLSIYVRDSAGGYHGWNARAGEVPDVMRAVAQILRATPVV